MSSNQQLWPAPPWIADSVREPRLDQGYQRQRVERQHLTSGIVGWKVGGNDVGTRARWRINGCVYGHLPADTCSTGDQTVDISAFSCAAVEPELWIEIASDLHDATDIDKVSRCIGKVGVTAELMDIAGRFDDVSTVIAGNIFHRRVAFSEASIPFDVDRIPAIQITASRNGQHVWRAIPVTALIADLRSVVSFIGCSLALDGDHLRAGQRILSGVLTPLPVWAHPGDRVTVEASGIGATTFHFESPRHTA
jgi:2-keto-4-pentenoate hydratase